MKKAGLLFFLILTLGSLFACNLSEENQAEASFTGTIEEISDSAAIVAVEEGDILSSGDRVSVDLSTANDTTFEVGDRVRIGYEGGVMESYPLQINTVFIEKLNK